MKVFKKTALLISVLVLAVVLSVGVIAEVADAAEANTTLGEVQSAVQVTTDGKVNLKVYYSTLGSAQAFVATVTDPVTNETVPYNYSLENLGEDANGKYVKVPLAPSEMTHTVRVWATAENGEKASDFVYETTVVDYANRVLADPDNAKYHDAMRALLNWGAMAQVFFDTDGETGTLANEDVFARSTNPMSVVTAASTGVANTGSGAEIFKQANVSLEPGNITMKISFALSDADASAITAYYSRKNVTNQALDVVADGENYAVTIKNIAVQNWNEAYTVTVKYGEGTYSYTYSLMNYLTYQLENGVDAVKNVAKTMFQFYQQALAAKDEYKFTDCAHEEGIFWISNGDGTDSYKCPVCYAQYANVKVPESVAVFISPYTISAPVAKAENNKITPNTHFEMTEKAFAFDGIPYFGFNGTGNAEYGKTSQLIWMRSAQDGSSSPHERWQLDIDQSKYIVIKARGNAGALTDLNFVFSTSGYEGRKSVKLPLSAAGADEWGVYVVDLSKVLSTYYVKNTETDTYELDTFYFNVLPFETTDRVELGYVAFVEDWADVDAIVDETTFYNVTDTAGAYVELNTADHTCAGAHTETVQVIDGVYKTACSVCGTVVRDHGVEADAVGLYWSAEELYRRSTTSTEGAYWTGGPVNQYLLTQDGETFLRISDMETNGVWGGWFPVHDGGRYAHPGSGRYMVIKVRQNDNSLNYSRIGFYVTSAGSSNTWDKGGFSVYLPEDNQWHVIVVDLAAKASGYTTDANGDYGIKTVHLRPFGGGSNMDTVTDEIMDIAYMAFFNNLADLKNIIAEDSFEMSQSASSSLVLDTDTLECVIHTADLTSDAQTRVEGENTTYYYTCSACGGECYAKTVPTTSAYLGPKYATQAVTYYNTTKSGLAIADGNVVGRVTGKTTDASQVIWLRNENDMATNQYTSVAENQTVNIGKAKYLIIKVQVNGAELTAWDVTFSTTGYNRVLSEQTTPMVRNKSYYYVDAEGTEHTLLTADVDAGTVSPEEGWTQKMVNVVSKTGMQSFKLPTAAVEQGEWVVFAIDLQTVLSTSFVADESGDYIIDSFYTTFNGLAAGATMDYAYFAYAEDWQGVDDIVDEATLIEVTDTAGSYNVVNVADHSTVAE